MERKLKLWMAKPVSDKGFTLIEMLVVIFVIGMLVVIFPMVRPQKQIQMRYELQNIKQILLQTQILAMKEHQVKDVQISNHAIQTPFATYQWMDEMTCDRANIRYLANGNVNQARTIRCQCMDKEGQIVIELGSGAIYVR